MPITPQPQPTPADRHDLDKLTRWKTALDAAPQNNPDPFPTCAIFLVSPQDHAAHNIFRQYRAAFEELGANFHHLIIFGQHGISTTATTFLAELGMEQTNIPLLAIVPLHQATRVYHIPLPKGDQNGESDDSQSWREILTSIRAAVTAQSPLTLDRATGANPGAFRHPSLTGAVNAAMRKLAAAP